MMTENDTNFQHLYGSENETPFTTDAFHRSVVDGEESEVSEFPCDNGTKIIVKNLFYNTPARLNYLKKPRTEYSYIADFLKQMSLSYPEVAFELVSDEKTAFTYRS